MNIILLGQPDCPYTVHFDSDEDKETHLTTVEKIRTGIQHSFHLIRVFFISLKDSVYTNIGSAGTSFKYIVLNLNNGRFPFQNIHLVAFKVVFWVTAMGWGTIATTVRLFLERTSPGHSLFLKQFASHEMNVDHIKTEELELDTSSVPESIQVSTLNDLFQKINFTEENAPGYMAPGALQEGDKHFTPEQLQENLKTFIHRINTREAFLGTPPAHDMPRLMDFYQQMENAVRLSIYKVKKDLDVFKEQNIDLKALSVEKEREYKDLLEIQARVALDLAIAGAHCGARYMGESMDVYYSIYHKEGIQNGKDLQGTLIEILAKKREEIAKGQIQKHLGTDAHNFTKYMTNMGKLLGIPGTKNIIEHLSTSIDIYQLLEYFFKEYTVDTIIDTIQGTIKTSKDFREKITDWIKDQVNDWNREKYENIDPIVTEIEKIRTSNPKTPEPALHLQMMQQLLVDLKKDKGILSTILPTIDVDWNNFLTEFFGLSEVKNRLKNRLPQNGGESDYAYMIRRLEYVNALKKSCSESVLGSACLKELKEWIKSNSFIPIPPSVYLPRFMEETKIKNMKAALATHNILMEEGTLSRMLTGEVGLEAAIKEGQERARQNAFLASFDLEEMAENGISKKLIEWILVSQKILRPQIESKVNSKVSSINLNRDQAKSCIRVVYEGFANNQTIPIERKIKLFALLNSGDENAEELLDLNEKRYRDDRFNPKERILIQIFNHSFQHDAEKVIAAAEKAGNIKSPFYPKWKEVCWIQLPKASSKLFSSWLFKSALKVAAIAISFFSIHQAYLQVEHFVAARAVPFMINHISLEIIRAGNTLIGVKEFVWEHSFQIILASWLVKKGIERLPEIPYLSAAARTITIWNMFRFFFFSKETIFGFILPVSLNTATMVWNTSQEISHRLHRISRNAEQERLILCKQKSFDVWKGCYKHFKFFSKAT